MATFTSFLNLRKPSTSDTVNVTLDLSDNFEAIDDIIVSLDSRLDTIEGVWTSFAPTVSPWTISNQTFRYKQIGKTVIYQGTFIATSFPAGALTISLPFEARSDAVPLYKAVGTWQALRQGVARYMDVALLNGSSRTSIVFGVNGSGIFVQHNNPATWLNGDDFSFEIAYEVA